MLGMDKHVTVVKSSRGRGPLNKLIVSISVSELCFEH